jgi:hypothetical protein
MMEWFVVGVALAYIISSLRDISNKTQLTLNGVSHVWGAVMELNAEEEE